jgi:hypothetical protein
MSIASGIKSAIKRPSFLIAFVILLLAGVGLNATTTFLKLKFRKEALPLRAELTQLPKKLGTWVAVDEQQVLDADMVHNLGTDKYMFRHYVDTSAKMPNGELVVTPTLLADLDKPDKRADALGGVQRRDQNAVMRLALTYYTGKVDTVPHVPDRCYVADGFQPSLFQSLSWGLGQYPSKAPRTVPVRFIDFEDQTSRAVLNRGVTYFFHANGEYMSDPNKVRFKLQDLFVKHAYFAKIEVMTTLPTRQGITNENDPLKRKDRDTATAAMQSFLAAALPEIEKLLPDFEAAEKAAEKAAMASAK